MAQEDNQGRQPYVRKRAGAQAAPPPPPPPPRAAPPLPPPKKDVIDLLNQRLAAAEHALASLPWRGAIFHHIDHKRAVCFTRDSDGWMLAFDPDWHSDNGDIKHWKECSLQERTLIAKYLPNLLKDVLSSAGMVAKQVAEGHAGLDEFELAFGSLKEVQ